MSMRRYLSLAGVGWLAGVGTTLALGLCSLAVFPGILRPVRTGGAVPGVPFVVVIMLVAASLPAVAGGLLGGRIPQEGGRRDQICMAAVCGGLAAVPFACFILWSLTGR
jgi:hypothetical protein